MFGSICHPLCGWRLVPAGDAPSAAGFAGVRGGPLRSQKTGRLSAISRYQLEQRGREELRCHSRDSLPLFPRVTRHSDKGRHCAAKECGSSCRCFGCRHSPGQRLPPVTKHSGPRSATPCRTVAAFARQLFVDSHLARVRLACFLRKLPF